MIIFTQLASLTCTALPLIISLLFLTVHQPRYTVTACYPATTTAHTCNATVTNHVTYHQPPTHTSPVCIASPADGALCAPPASPTLFAPPPLGVFAAGAELEGADTPVRHQQSCSIPPPPPTSPLGPRLFDDGAGCGGGALPFTVAPPLLDPLCADLAAALAAALAAEMRVSVSMQHTTSTPPPRRYLSPPSPSPLPS